jgi:diguanylate cyclase (GGDEF)-like protein/PAS domain S-box-containing protein
MTSDESEVSAVTTHENGHMDADMTPAGGALRGESWKSRQRILELNVRDASPPPSEVPRLSAARGVHMRRLADADRRSVALARRALLLTAVLAVAGSGLGVFAALRGEVAGIQIVLVLSCLLLSVAALVLLLFCRDLAVQTIATVATTYFAIHLCAGAFAAVRENGHHLNLLVYLVWFFPLLVFNKLVNEPAVARFLAKGLLLAPFLVLGLLLSRLPAEFDQNVLFFLGAYGLSYISFALMLDIVARYREEYIVERERAESLKTESEILESLSDSFISVDSEFRLIYLNNAACSEFAVERSAVLNRRISDAAPSFFSQSMREPLLAASAKITASMFEVQNERKDRWYEMRCFPRPDGISIYFRNVTESVLSRHRVEEAQRSMRQQAELLDKAQDAIFVQDMDERLIYWNKSAERLYGWTAEEVMGRRLGDIFHDTLTDTNQTIACVLRTGEWGGELSHIHRNGNILVVESHWTLVRGEDGEPRSILSINTDITNRKAAEAKIHHLAFYDVLTELPNRSLLQERLEKALEITAQRGGMGALFFIDLDDFKTLNDTLGHDIGDLLLQQVAHRLRSCVRSWDTVARLGGDEFVVMLEGFSEDARKTATDARAVGDKILKAIRQTFELRNFEYNCTASIGVTLFPEWCDTVEDLLKRADLAMYRAKAQARDGMCFFDPEMQTFVASRAALLSDLRRALQTRSFELHYQPQVDRDRSVTGAEALLRWRHPRGRMVPPNEFIPLAEDAGLIAELGRWVLETACAELAEWADRPEMEALSLSVNVSSRQFRDPSFVNLVQEVLRASGSNPQRLKLEITESSAMENVDDTITKMMALKAFGVGFSLDDFGTGHSSLSHLKRLPLDEIKIDRSFVRDVLTDSKDASIARTIITLGQNLNLSVIAEGVETEGQREFLEREGCLAYQGYLYSKALPASQFAAFVRDACLREQDADLISA